MLNSVSRVAAKYGSQRQPVAGTKNDMGKDEFLQLLTQQLKYQDPLSPMDNQEFIAQMAQFSSLEQMKNVNDNLDVFLKVSALNEQRSQAVNLIGKTINGLNKNGQDVTGKVDAVRFDNGLPVLLINKQEVMFSQISWISG